LSRPAVRLGRQPYGVLPVTSLNRWQLLDPPEVDAVLPPLLDQNRSYLAHHRTNVFVPL